MVRVSRAGCSHSRILAYRSVLLSTSALLAFIALAEAPVAAQTAQQGQQEPLPRVDVEVSRARPPARPARPKRAQGVRTQRAPAPAPAPEPVVQVAPVDPIANVPSPGITPLNVVTESGSRLGLTVRETPATIEVLNKDTIQEQGYRTTTEAVQGFVGVTGGDSPAAPANFSMRGFSESQINTLYNGIKVGPSAMTNRPMDTGNLDRIEILKGPASLLSGEGATAGAVNYVTKAPHTGNVINEAFTSFDSLNGYRWGIGSGGSTPIKGLDYRFDLTRSFNNSFIDDTYTRLFNVSGQLNYRVNESLKIWGAAEYKEDKDRFYYGTPLVPSNFPGIVATSGIVHGVWSNYWLNGGAGPKNPVTIDARTLDTSYNVLDNRNGAKELWLRGGWEYSFNNSLTLRSQFYGYDAQRHWFNNEVSSFVDDPADPNFGKVYRERLALDHDQRLFGTISDLIWNGTIAGMDNRSVLTVAGSSLQFNVNQDTLFGNDYVNLVNPNRGLYGPRLDERFLTHLDDIAVAFEDRLKVTQTFALVGGVRMEKLDLERNRISPEGVVRTDRGYPFSKSWEPVTGRIGYTWEAIPGLTFYSQYATAADPAVANIFIIRPTQPLLLTESRTVETGVKQVLWNNRAEWMFSAFDIERNNVYENKTGHQVTVAAKVHAKGVEFSGAVRPIDQVKLWGNIALLESKYEDFVDTDGVVFTGKTPPNTPKVVANAGASYRFETRWPVEVGGVVRYVGDRFNNDDNLVVMDAYTIGDLYAFVDIAKKDLPWQSLDLARFMFRVRNVTDRRYAIWADSGYPDQILLGAPRTYELSAAFKW